MTFEWVLTDTQKFIKEIWGKMPQWYEACKCGLVRECPQEEIDLMCLPVILVMHGLWLGGWLD